MSLVPTVTVSVSATPSELRIREGASATYVCRGQGYPTPQLKWSRGNQV